MKSERGIAKKYKKGRRATKDFGKRSKRKSQKNYCKNRYHAVLNLTDRSRKSGEKKGEHRLKSHARGKKISGSRISPKDGKCELSLSMSELLVGAVVVAGGG